MLDTNISDALHQTITDWVSQNKYFTPYDIYHEINRIYGDNFEVEDARTLIHRRMANAVSSGKYTAAKHPNYPAVLYSPTNVKKEKKQIKVSEQTTQKTPQVPISSFVWCQNKQKEQNQFKLKVGVRGRLYIPYSILRIIPFPVSNTLFVYLVGNNLVLTNLDTNGVKIAEYQCYENGSIKIGKSTLDFVRITQDAYLYVKDFCIYVNCNGQFNF